MRKRLFYRLFLAGLTSAFCLPSLHAEPLQGSASVESHIERLVPGVTFVVSELGPMHTKRCWYQIPAWFAGTWHREVQFADSQWGSMPSLSKRDRIRGMQIDMRGRIWHACDEPSYVIVDAGNFLDYKLVESIEPIDVSESQVVLRYLTRCFTVAKKNNKIVAVYRTNDTHIYTPSSDGSIHCQSNCVYLGSHGERIHRPLEQSHFTDQLIEPFKKIDVDDHRNYSQDFVQYLEQTGQMECMQP